MAAPARGGGPQTSDLAVVVPVRDEVESVRPLLSEIVAALEGRLAYEIVFVDDGSRDGTRRALAEAARELGRLRVIEHRECYGQSAALWSGVRAARAPLVATLDGDGQNDPADILRLKELFDQIHDPRLMIVGHRRKRRDSWVRRLSSRVANGVSAWCLGDGVHDRGSGLKLFERELYLGLPYFDHMHRFLPALVLRAGGRVRSIEVNHRPRAHGATKYGTWGRLKVGVVDLLGMMWLKRRGRFPEVMKQEEEG
jgi:dolichol-phosphate mannosyltransferase